MTKEFLQNLVTKYFHHLCDAVGEGLEPDKIMDFGHRLMDTWNLKHFYVTNSVLKIIRYIYSFPNLHYTKNKHFNITSTHIIICCINSIIFISLTYFPRLSESLFSPVSFTCLFVPALHFLYITVCILFIIILPSHSPVYLYFGVYLNVSIFSLF